MRPRGFVPWPDRQDRLQLLPGAQQPTPRVAGADSHQGQRLPEEGEERTPAMTEGIADHIMTLDELLSIPVSPELCHND